MKAEIEEFQRRVTNPEYYEDFKDNAAGGGMEQKPQDQIAEQ